MIGRVNFCLHEAAHSVARQLLIGDLGETGLKKGFGYSYPVEMKPLKEIGKEELSRIAVVVAAGIAAEENLCSGVGPTPKHVATADDERQLSGIQGIAGFSDDEMAGFLREGHEIVEKHEAVIRRVATEINRRNRLTGEQVSRIVAQHTENPAWGVRHQADSERPIGISSEAPRSLPAALLQRS